MKAYLFSLLPFLMLVAAFGGGYVLGSWRNRPPFPPPWVGVEDDNPEKQNQRKQQRVEKVLNKLTRKLELEEEQVSQIKPLLEDFFSAMMELRRESKGKFAELRKQHESNLREILSPEQWEKLKKHRKHKKEQRKRWQERHRDRP